MPRSGVPRCCTRARTRRPGESLLVGLGPADELDADALRTAASSVAEAAERVGGTLAWVLDDSLPPLRASARDRRRALARLVRPGPLEDGGEVRPPVRAACPRRRHEELKAQAERAATVADAANRARDLANTGANGLTPEKLAERASEIADEHEHLTARGARPRRDHGARHGRVRRRRAGQPQPGAPDRHALRAAGPPKADLVLGLVGKAITFDTGGISIKPALYMEDMKGDMAGGGAVIEASGAIAELGLPLRALAVVAATRERGRRRRLPAGRHPHAPRTARRSRSRTPTPRAGSCSPTRSGTRASTARRTSSTSPRSPGAMEVALGDLYAGVFAQRRRLARRRSSPPARRAATTPGRSRCTRATAATSTPPSPT